MTVLRVLVACETSGTARRALALSEKKVELAVVYPWERAA